MEFFMQNLEPYLLKNYSAVSYLTCKLQLQQIISIQQQIQVLRCKCRADVSPTCLSKLHLKKR
ncbi:hypothetical protein BRADI_1g28312v3 [Brachypodium distachyon]|uniref:Uncharacterized protein n=1 Tax=Brachypodium distachyon TaxID=15368 RepID=A0A2K2DLL7_BRADI|nr:hypothetical protein BRADI_1g28312v3 [Brachypodium distachyon]